MALRMAELEPEPLCRQTQDAQNVGCRLRMPMMSTSVQLYLQHQHANALNKNQQNNSPQNVHASALQCCRGLVPAHKGPRSEAQVSWTVTSSLISLTGRDALAAWCSPTSHPVRAHATAQEFGRHVLCHQAYPRLYGRTKHPHPPASPRPASICHAPPKPCEHI